MLADIADVQMALDMDDAAGEMLGFFPDTSTGGTAANAIAEQLNAGWSAAGDEFAPTVATSNQPGTAEIMDYMERCPGIVAIFTIVMSIVLWNAGLIASLRRYGEIGLRLAFGESQGHLYRALIVESLVIGLFGSLVGTVLGLVPAYWLQSTGFDISSFMPNSSLVFNSVIRAHIPCRLLHRVRSRVARDRHRHGNFRHGRLQAADRHLDEGVGDMKPCCLEWRYCLPPASVLRRRRPPPRRFCRRSTRTRASRTKITVWEMTVHGRRGSRTMKAKSWIQGVDQAFTEYLDPPREAGTKMLKIGDQLWTYSPSTDRTIQIAGHMLRQSVMGSDMSYEDLMEDPKLQNLYDAKVSGEETVLERPCWVLELAAKSGTDPAYHSRKVWVDKERFLVLKEERFATGGKLLKTSEVKKMAQMHKRWVAEHAVFRDALKNDGGTEFVVRPVEFDPRIPESVFSQASLRK